MFAFFRFSDQNHACASIGPIFNDQACSSKIGPIRYPETSVTNYHSTLCNITEERRSQLHCGGNLK